VGVPFVEGRGSPVTSTTVRQRPGCFISDPGSIYCDRSSLRIEQTRIYSVVLQPWLEQKSSIYPEQSDTNPKHVGDQYLERARYFPEPDSQTKIDPVASPASDSVGQHGRGDDRT
jgi:hypothetical protein